MTDNQNFSEQEIYMNGLHSLLDHEFGLSHRGKRILENALVITIEITTSEGTTVVPNDDAIRIQHRYDLEDKCVPEKLRGKKQEPQK